MKKKISLVLVAMVFCISLTACGKFTCDICGEEKGGKKYSAQIWGEKLNVCKDCYGEIQELQKELQGLFN